MSSGITHWGTAVAAALEARDVDTMFTLSGGHLFPIFDGAVQRDIRLIDVRHEGTAAFAAEGYSRLGRRAGVAAVTAGPGVFNSTAAVAQAQKNGSALLVLGGRAPETRWGMGSLQEIDHVPVMTPLTKRAETAGEEVLYQVSSGIREALTAPRGPVFFDFPLDLITNGERKPADTGSPLRTEPDPDVVTRILDLAAASSRPMLLAGGDVYLDGAEDSMRQFAESTRLAVFTNGGGRGTVPADHQLAFSRCRSKAMAECDLAIVAGTPLDFRVGFGDRFPRDASIIHLASAKELLTSNRDLAAGMAADLDLTFRALSAGARPSASRDWLEALRRQEERLAAEVDEELASDRRPIHPMRIYGELRKLLDRDAVIIGDGGDFVSYAGRELPSFVPGAWLDPGPFGGLGCGPGYAIAAKLLYPGRQVVLLLGDGSFGFAGLEFDTMVRHGLPVVGVVGNNGIWALEKHPMRAFFGYDVVAELRQETRYDLVVEALGGYGETVADPGEIGPALKRAFEAGVPALINVLTDPEVVYPRSANLA